MQKLRSRKEIYDNIRKRIDSLLAAGDRAQLQGIANLRSSPSKEQRAALVRHLDLLLDRLVPRGYRVVAIGDEQWKIESKRESVAFTDPQEAIEFCRTKLAAK